jgi:hypothetical protein
MSAIRPKHLVPLAVLITCPLSLAACSSGSSAPVTTHPAGVPYLTRSGTGSETLPAVGLPSRWTLIWRFSCTNPTSRRPFVLTATPSGGSTKQVTNQNGLEGGGYHPFTTAGTYTFAVTTTCSWKVVVGTAGMQTIPTAAPS